MGFARTARFALAIVVAGVAAATVDAGALRPPRGVHVTAVVHLADDELGNMPNPVPPRVFFDADGDVIAAYHTHDGGVYRRIAPDGATSVVKPPSVAGPFSQDADGSVYGLSTQDGQSQLVRVGLDGRMATVPIDPGGSVEQIGVRNGRVHVLTERLESDRAWWLQRFSLDGTPDWPAVRVSPPAAPPTYGGATIAADSDGSTHVLWQSATVDAQLQRHDFAVNWQRVDADGSVSPPVRVFGSVDDDAGAIYFWWARLGPDGTTWVLPMLDGSTDARGPIGIRRDGVVLPVIDLHATFDRHTGAGSFATFGVDAAGEVRTLLLPGGYVGSSAPPLSRWRPIWQRFAADATPLRSRRLVEPRHPRSRIGPSGVWFEEMEVAPDGSSLIAVNRRETKDLFGAGNPAVLEFLHLGPDGRVLSTGSFPPAFQVNRHHVTSTMVAGRPRFAITWLARTAADAPLTAFVAILE